MPRKIKIHEAVLIYEISETLGYTFKNPSLLQESLTHPSTNVPHSYERLEFLGDSVLGLVISEMLFRLFPDEEEGDLSKRYISLVNREILVKIAKEMKIYKYIIAPSTESSLPSQDSVLENTLEAIIAAIYLDGGLEEVKDFIYRYWYKDASSTLIPPSNFKSELQEWTQKRKLPLPTYIIEKITGSDHNPIFIISATVQGYTSSKAEGKTKREAEQKAASLILQKISDNS